MPWANGGLTVPSLPSVSNADPCWPSWRWKCKKSTWGLGTGCSRKCPLSRAPRMPPSSSTCSHQAQKRTSFLRTCAWSSCRPWGVTGQSCLSGGHTLGRSWVLIAGEHVPGADLANLLSSRINQGQMLVTFADSHSALSVLDVDGMKVRRAWSPGGGRCQLLVPPGFLCFCVARSANIDAHRRAGAGCLFTTSFKKNMLFFLILAVLVLGCCMCFSLVVARKILFSS